ncbi:unnamed protein product [Umbelopsis vinacea]
MKSIVAAIAALAIAAVSAQTTPPVSITSPLTGTVYTAGGQALITWINPTAATLAQIQLAKGPSNALQPVGVVATNVATAGGQYSWTIPADTPAGTDYAFELGASPNIAFTGFFTIQAATGATTNSSASASGSVAASSAASSVAASSAASSSAPASSAPASSSAASSSAAASGSASATPSASAKSGANAVKAGVVGAGLVAGAAALLF